MGQRVEIPEEALDGAIHRANVRLLGVELDWTGTSFADAPPGEGE